MTAEGPSPACVCRINEALEDARWEDTEGAASHRVASEAWFQQDLIEYRACPSPFTFGFIPIVCSKSTQAAMNRGMGKMEKMYGQTSVQITPEPVSIT